MDGLDGLEGYVQLLPISIIFQIASICHLSVGKFSGRKTQWLGLFGQDGWQIGKEASGPVHVVVARLSGRQGSRSLPECAKVKTTT